MSSPRPSSAAAAAYEQAWRACHMFPGVICRECVALMLATFTEGLVAELRLLRDSLEATRYANADCPRCHQRVHTADCRLVVALTRVDRVLGGYSREASLLELGAAGGVWEAVVSLIDAGTPVEGLRTIATTNSRELRVALRAALP